MKILVIDDDPAMTELIKSGPRPDQSTDHYFKLRRRRSEPGKNSEPGYCPAGLDDA